MSIRLSYHRWKRAATGLFAGMLLMGGLPLLTNAQEPTAVINALDEEVLVSIQGTTPTFGIRGTVLRTGDVIRTYHEASVLLNVSDGSRIELGEHTNVTLSGLAQEPETGVRKTSLDVAWGRIRGILSPVYQAQGASFVVQTPNALISVKSSEADVEVLYEPETRVTTVLAHEFAVQVIHLLTGTSLRIPQGHSAIIRETIMQEIAEIIALPVHNNVQGQTATITSVSGDALAAVQGRDPTPVMMSMVLRAGDVLQTNIGAAAVLECFNGATVNLGEHTKMRLKMLAEDNESGRQTSRLEVFRGRLRARIPGEQQPTGSSFTIVTPNVEAALQASAKADVEILYDPAASITTVMAHEADVLITHLLTDTTAVIPAGHSGIIYNHVIQEVARILSGPLEAPTPQTEELPSAEETTEERSTP
jgi:hypothetical protein